MGELLDHLPIISADIGRSEAESTSDARCDTQDFSLLQGTCWLLPSTSEDTNGPLKCPNRLLQVRALLIVICSFLLADGSGLFGAFDVP